MRASARLSHKIALASIVLLGACASQPEAPVQAPPPRLPPPTEQQILPPPVVEAQNPITKPPELGPVKPLTVPAVVERTLSNGLRLLIVEHRELPIADVILVVKTGSEADPPAKQGVGSLVAAMLDEGTTSRNALQIAEQIAFLGVSLSTGGGWDASRVQLHTPITQLDSALALMADVALRPSFPANELERLRQERLTTLLQLKDRGPALADLAYSHILFGEEHPYGRPQLGNEKTVAAITRVDVRQFYDTFYRPNNAALVIVGDVQPDDAQRRVERLFGAWQRGTVPPTRFGAPPSATQPTVYLIDKPGAAQSSFRLGAVGVPRATQDFFPIQVMNTILGASFTSRLNQNLRETKGYTYGAGSSFDMRQAAGPFTARAEIVTAKSDSALIEFMKELRAIRESVPATELDKAKNYLQLGLPASFESTSDIAGRLIPIALYNLPLDYFNTYSQRIAAVTAADVQRVAQQYVRPEQMHIVIVGDLKTIEQGIRSLRIGKVELRDLSGRPIVQ
jgi:zinc protease